VKQKLVPDIAVVGIALRFPGRIEDEVAFWEVLRSGRCVVGEVGRDRWATDVLVHPRRSEPGRSITFAAGTLGDVSGFDAGFFGISPREAALMDPQQRLLLELSWEAMENAGLPPSRLRGSDCAVYVGISGLDYGVQVMDDLSAIGPHSMTGSTLSIAANRLSYFYDLRGPSVAVDTACSSSLVALHHACETLRTGTASTALVGGVNMLLHPYPFVGFTKASMLSASGLCRPFDAEGDGYVRAEGGAVLLLKPLDAALAEGCNIYGVILASGINADGSRKTGITIPSWEGQAELMRSVLRRSGLDAGDVDYVEAHGTGTPVGDPIEAKAIGDVYGKARRQGRPLPIGSVKSNLGHLEAASGMAGFMKALVVLRQHQVPPTLHLEKPNPNIDFAGLQLDAVTRTRGLARDDGSALVAGVNSFGFGGANAHVLLQEYRSTARRPPEPPAVPALVLSARSAQALRSLAGLYAEQLKAEPEALPAMAAAALYRRDRLDQLAAFPVGDVGTVIAGLEAFAAGETPAGVVTETAVKAEDPVRIAFLYTGNGSQWPGMGLRLLEEAPRFTALLDELDRRMAPVVGFSVRAVLADPDPQRFDDTAVAQPALFALQVVLTRMLREAGVEVHAVAGHSVGEVAAAWASGALDLDQAIRVIHLRSAAQARTRGQGRMAAAALSAEAAAELIAKGGHDRVEIAGINSPRDVTLSGPLDQLEALGRTVSAQGTFFRVLDLDYAFHSAAMDPVEADLVADLAGLAPGPASDALYFSTVTGDGLDGSRLGPAYWWDNVRLPVRFGQAVAAMADQGCRLFVEIGPHAILQRYVTTSLEGHGGGRVFPLLRRGDDGLERVEKTAAALRLLVSPPAVQLAAVPSVALPTYPWQRERHWMPATSEGYGLMRREPVHPLLGWRLKEIAIGWENVLDPAKLPWLADHKVGQATVLPGAAFAEMALAAGREFFEGAPAEIEGLDIVYPIVFEGERGYSTRLVIGPRDGAFQILGRRRLTDDPWTVHAAGRLAKSAATPAPRSAIEAPGPAATVLSGAEHHALTQAVGLDYGPAFRGLERVATDGSRLEATIVPGFQAGAAEQGYLFHPAATDLCFQALVCFFAGRIAEGERTAFLPVRIGSFRQYAVAPVAAFRARLFTGESRRSARADFELLDAGGALVATMADCRFRAAPIEHAGTVAPTASWRIGRRLAPLPAAEMDAPLPDTAALMAELAAWATAAAPQREAYHGEARPLIDALAVALIAEAADAIERRRPGWLAAALERPAELPAETRLAACWLTSVLAEEAMLRRDGAETPRVALGELPPATEIWQTLVRHHPVDLPEVMTISRLARALPDLLAGDGSATLPVPGYQDEILVEEAPAYAGVRAAIQALIGRLVAAWPRGRRLRVLEILPLGGRALAAGALAALPEDRVCHVVAGLDDEGMARIAAEQAAGSPVTLARLDVETGALGADDALPAHYDVIVFGQGAHRLEAPTAVLSRLQTMVAADGLLLLAERSPDLPANLAQVLTSDWWHLGPAGEVVSRLRPAQSWIELVARTGFAEVHAWHEAESEEGGAYLVLARRPDDGAIARPVPPPAAAWALVYAPATADLAAGLQSALLAAGQTVTLVPDTGFVASPATAQAALAGLGAPGHLVWLPAAAGAELAQAFDEQPLIGLFHLANAAAEAATPPRLWVVTRGGALEGAGDGLAADPLQGALWGLGRVVMNESHTLDCTLVDLAPGVDAAEGAALLSRDLLWPDGEREIVLEAEGRFALRMDRAAATTVAPPAAAARFRLNFHTPGQLRNLLWEPLPEAAPLAPGMVEVAVAATGMNFRDVMYLMGLLPDEAVEKGFAGASLGLEMAGVVTRVGEGVTGFAPGDAVMGFGASCYASHVVTRADALTHKPAEWSFAAAATVPTTFFTVYYALVHLADVQPGERVLIHGGAGGVGIAAMQLARHLGAEIFVTVGSAEKRAFVEWLGADHVFDSRSLDFADEILAITGGEGVDVVLNSLAGEAIRRNLRILRPFGRFLELGKRDFYENTPIGLRPFKDNISYFGIDADQLLTARPALAARLFGEVMALFRAGVLVPLPHRLFGADHVVEAFRTLQQARQIGKIVVSMADAKVRLQAPPRRIEPRRFARDETWLVTGGLAGFGLESAAWLAQRGVGCVVLAGRRGTETPGAAGAAARLEAAGVRVELRRCDVADRAAVAALIADLGATCPPLTGILHAAMVLDDGLMASLDAARWHSVLAPKIQGALNLHHATRDLALRHFVLYSSITTFIGNPGQANYVAANAALERLAAWRRAHGLPAVCVAWGPIGDAGYLARNEAVRDSLAARLGAPPLAARAALDLLDRALAEDGGTLAFADFDYATLAKVLPSATTPRFAALRDAAGFRDEAGEDIASLLAGRTPDEARAIVIGLAARELAEILGVDAETIEAEKPFSEMGLDSLMAVELGLGLERRFGVRVPAMMANARATVGKVADFIVERLLQPAGEGPAPGNDLLAVAQALAESHGEELSLETVEGGIVVETRRQQAVEPEGA